MKYLFYFFLIPTIVFSQVGFNQTGKGSYYNDRYHGQKTKSGEKYDMNSYTAAHRELPMQTKIKVTNIKNNKSVILRVNDRGPFSHGRIVDVSKVAAKELGMIEEGVVNVKLEVIQDTTEKETPNVAKDSTSVTSTTKPNKVQPKEETSPVAIVTPPSVKSVKTLPKEDSLPAKNLVVEVNTEVKTTSPKSVSIKPTTINNHSDSLDPKVDLKDASSEIFKPGYTYNVNGMIMNPKGFGIQVGSFNHIFNALVLCKNLSEFGFAKLFVKSEKESVNANYKVFIGDFETDSQAEVDIVKLREKKLDYMVKKYTENKLLP
jgi:rare lipoprotein A